MIESDESFAKLKETPFSLHEVLTLLVWSYKKGQEDSQIAISNMQNSTTDDTLSTAFLEILLTYKNKNKLS